MNSNIGNTKVFYSSPPFLKYLLSAVFVAVASLISFLQLAWYYQALAWTLALILTIAVFKTYVKFSILPDGLNIKVGLSGLYRYGYTSMFIPRGDLCGIYSLSSPQPEKNGLFYKDANGIIRYLIPPFEPKTINFLKHSLQSEYPEMTCPNNLKDLVFGKKLKEIKRAGLPWKGLIAEQSIKILVLVFFVVVFASIAVESGLTGKKIIELVIKEAPWNIKLAFVATCIFPFMLLFTNWREISRRRRNRDVILITYEKGLALKPGILIHDNFIAWDRIADIKLGKIHPRVIIDCIQPDSKKFPIRIEGYLDDSDFQEIRNYVDINRKI